MLYDYELALFIRLFPLYYYFFNSLEKKQFFSWNFPNFFEKNEKRFFSEMLIPTFGYWDLCIFGAFHIIIFHVNRYKNDYQNIMSVERLSKFYLPFWTSNDWQHCLKMHKELISYPNNYYDYDERIYLEHGHINIVYLGIERFSKTKNVSVT